MQGAMANCISIEDQLHEAGNPLNQDVRDTLDHLRSRNTVFFRVEFEFVLLLLCFEHVLPCVCHLPLHCFLELMMVVVCVVSVTIIFRRLLLSLLEELDKLSCSKRSELMRDICVFDLLFGPFFDHLSYLTHALVTVDAHVWKVVCFKIEHVERLK